MHKYPMHSGDFAMCKLPNEAITFLKNAVTEITNLTGISDQILTNEKEKVDVVLKCLEDTVKPIFPDVRSDPFGSRATGLVLPGSDIDVLIDCGKDDENHNIKEYRERLLTSVKHCFQTNQQSWKIEDILVTTSTPIIRLLHRDTDLHCDVACINGLYVESAKLLKCYIKNYPLCRKLMLFLKKWFSLCGLSGFRHISNYAIYWYIVFYLQSKSILPSVASLIAKENKSKLFYGWEIGISETFDVNAQGFTFIELVRGFFDFYSIFDFRDSVACPLIGRTLPKQDFAKLDLLPKEMTPYINRIVNNSVDGLVCSLKIDSEMCIQDPYVLSDNLTKAVGKSTFDRFKRLCEASADVLNNSIQH